MTSEEKKQSNSVRMKAVWEEIRLLSKHLGISLDAAQKEYHKRRSEGTLEVSLSEARESGLGSDLDLCPKCMRAKLVIKNGSLGQFLGCADYPRCKFTQNISQQVPDCVPSDTEAESFISMMREAVEFAKKAGGVAAAKRWLYILETAMNG